MVDFGGIGAFAFPRSLPGGGGDLPFPGGPGVRGGGVGVVGAGGALGARGGGVGVVGGTGVGARGVVAGRGVETLLQLCVGASEEPLPQSLSRAEFG